MELKRRKKFAAPIGALLAATTLLSTMGVSHAAAILNNRTDIPGGDALTPPPGDPFLTIYPNGTGFFKVTGSGTVTGTFTGPNTTGVQKLIGSSTSGNFGVNQPIFSTNQTPGALTINFDTDIFAVGTQFQTSNLGSFDARIEAFDASNTSLGFFTKTGTSNNNGDNSAIFLGLAASPSDNAIRKVVLSTTNDAVQFNTSGIAGSFSTVAGTFVVQPGGAVPFSGGFGINPLSFSTTRVATAPVPEPGTMSLMAIGLAGLAGASRRKKKKAESEAAEDEVAQNDLA